MLNFFLSKLVNDNTHPQGRPPQLGVWWNQLEHSVYKHPWIWRTSCLELSTSCGSSWGPAFGRKGKKETARFGHTRGAFDNQSRSQGLIGLLSARVCPIFGAS
ncbi:hypothetical protein BSKO_04608 [Bryopsis sp. KO-2023]|nr:hypothetical protein BSKO_04608 [Bryopsis sp. KO-2023]